METRPPLSSLLLLLWFYFSLLSLGYAQQEKKLPPEGKFLLVDRYGKQQMKFNIGDQITFSLKGDPKLRYTDIIGGFGQNNTIILASMNAYLEISQIGAFYFSRPGWRTMRGASYVTAAGFVGYSFIGQNNEFYNRQEGRVLGLGLLGLGQLTRFLDVKKFKVTKNTRLRVIDLSFG